ncbi:Uncharacterised protein [Klebsiella michiganensis]|nr:Uncharacterised protein [Klebsiella michiganensis]SBL65849.1 Uncharacterised protein [Klebsiella michiganensis]
MPEIIDQANELAERRLDMTIESEVRGKHRR